MDFLEIVENLERIDSIRQWPLVLARGFEKVI